MAACTTALGIGNVRRTATGHLAPRVAIPRGPRVTHATFRRRRLAVALLALGVVVVAARAGVALGGSPLAVPERRPASSSASEHRVVVVAPGDTLWSIATRLSPDDDPRPIVDELSEARDGAPLQPGERILLPQ